MDNRENLQKRKFEDGNIEDEPDQKKPMQPEEEEEREPESEDDKINKKDFNLLLDDKEEEKEREQTEGETISQEDNLSESDWDLNPNDKRILNPENYSGIFFTEHGLVSFFLIPDIDVSPEERKVLNVMSTPDKRRFSTMSNFCQFGRNVPLFDELVEKWQKYLVTDFLDVNGRFQTAIKHLYNINLKNYTRD